MTSVRPLAAFLAGVALVATACDDPIGLDAQVPVFTDTTSVFAISGTPASYPSVLNLFSISTGLLQSGAQFDIAFDIDEDGNAVLYPASLISAGALRVGLRDTSLAFDQIGRAPRGTYAFDAPLVLAPGGEVAIAEVQSGLCQFSISPFFYSKLVVDSIDLDQRKLYLRVTTDPNCGFRSFENGVIPRD